MVLLIRRIIEDSAAEIDCGQEGLDEGPARTSAASCFALLRMVSQGTPPTVDSEHGRFERMSTNGPGDLLAFGDFRLDRGTRQLRNRGQARRLRAKSSAVLLYLAEHPNRLVTRDEVLRSVWPDTKVSPTVLRVCIREIRVALGADADRFLTTIPRRGYRFALEENEGSAGSPLFVGRSRALAALHEALAGARRGVQQLVLVEGAPGTGKTALVNHFLDEIRADGEVRAARGQAVDLYGPTDGGAIFLDLLNQLCDEARGDEALDVLARKAPGWLLQLPHRLDDETAEQLRRRQDGASGEGRLLELREALKDLAGRAPLVLVLEDLQWSDAAAVDALAYLLRTWDSAPLLVVATFRGDDLRPDHPFEEARPHLETASWSTQVRLDALSSDEVRALLDTRLAPHPVENDVAPSLDAHCSGHPASLTALVDRLVDAGCLAVRKGRWAVDDRLADLAAQVLSRGPRTQSRAGDPGLAAERRQLSVLCCDLVTGPDQPLDPEDLRDVTHAFQALATEIVGRFEGHIAQHLVDGLVVYFGYPRANEDDAARAVRAGLEILAALQPLKEEVQRTNGVALSVRIGVHTGTVVMDESMGRAGREALALGDVPRIAGRAQRAAETGHVVVTGATRALVEGMFVLEEAAAPDVDGSASSLSLFAVVETSGTRERLSAAAGHPTPFVGRADEMATLVDHLKATVDGRGRTVLVRGDAGIGKSRLVFELRQRADAGTTWLEAGATPYHSGASFQPVVDLVAQTLDFGIADSTPQRLEKVERSLGPLATPENVALVAELVSLPPPMKLLFSPELRRTKTIELLSEWILQVATAGPTVMVVEDLHWLDPSSTELLGHLVERAPKARLLLLLTARPQFEPTWGVSETETVELARLEEGHVRTMVRGLAAQPLPAATIDAVASRSDGVPLFVEEITKSLATSPGQRDSTAVPATLADSLMGRLDRLARAKEVAQRASVFGREFQYSLLASVAGIDEASLRQALRRLVDAGIVFATGEPPHATFVFKHALIQETAYESLLKSTRREQHGRIARLLERRAPGDVRLRPELVAEHYDRAGLAEDAVRHYQRAGELAADRSANDEALLHLRRALTLLEEVPASPERQRCELSLLMALAGPLSAARGWANPEYEGVFVRARRLAAEIEAAPELPRVIEGMAAATLMKGDVNASLEIGYECLATAEETGDTFDLLISHVCVGTPILFQGRFALALEHLEQAINLYDPTDQPAFGYMVGFDRGIAAHAYAGLCSWYVGQSDRAVALCRKAIELAKRLDHPLTLVNALLQMSLVHYERRDFDAMADTIAELIGTSERFGFPFWRAAGLVFRGITRVNAGESEQGVADMQDALAGLAEMGNGLGAPGVLVVQAEALWKAGRHDEASGMLDLAAAQAEAMGQFFADPDLLRLRAEILLDRDPKAVDEAAAFLDRAITRARQLGARLFELRSSVRLGEVLLEQGKRDEARELVERAYESITEGVGTPDLRNADALLDRLESTIERLR